MSSALPDRAIGVLRLSKRYGTHLAVDDLTFTVERGTVFALLGPNGAGKTTTVEILEGYRRPDGGEVSVLGLDPIADAAKLRPLIGAMIQEGGLYPAITPRDALRLFAAYYEHPRSPAEMLDLVGLQAAARTRFRQLSGGQKQRLGLALALIGRPQLVFLDEPTAGMDPQARRATWDIIRDQREQGVTVILTTHYLEEAEQLADQVAIIDQGAIVAMGRPTDLMHEDTSRVRLRTAAPVALGTLLSLTACENVDSPEPCVYMLSTDDAPTMLVQVTTMLRDRGVAAVELRVGEASLEDVFLRLTGDSAA